MDFPALRAGWRRAQLLLLSARAARGPAREEGGVASRGRVVVLHFVGQMPLAGIAWQAMHYLLGLERLGYEAWYVEDHGANPYDPRLNSVSMDCAYNVAYLRRVDGALRARRALGLLGRDQRRLSRHESRERVAALYREADALINLCGAMRLRDEHMACPVRVMVDTDPVYEQIKYAEADPRRARLSRRAHAFLHLWRECRRAGLDRAAVRHSVAADAAAGGARRCGPRRAGEGDCFTTIATWENKGKNIAFGGETYVWSKHVNFLRFLDLPQRTGGLLHRWRCCRRRAAVERRGRPARAGASSIRARSRPT